MMANGQEADLHKRKRSPEDNGRQPGHPERIPQPPPPQSVGATPINYLTIGSTERLKLIHGDADTFSDVISLLDQYEGVLFRHESFAANLGAKLPAPRLLKALEGAFEGPIKATPTTDCPLGSVTPTWLDIVKFAKTNPNEFTLTSTPDHGRACQFYLKGYHVEITEDDWRLIMSGAMDRLLPVFPSPFEEDESAELATLEILDKRLQYLIKKADEVARKARQLNWHLSGRKATMDSRRMPPQGQGMGFQAVNHPARSGPNPGYNLKEDLLQQFQSPTVSLAASNRALGSSVPPTPTTHSVVTTPKPTASHQLTSRPSPAFMGETSQLGPASAAAPAEDPSALHRPLITARIEKLARGEPIYPPCDRCRRLKVPCVKHLTACQGCTKKHAKCGWKFVTDDELAYIKGQGAGGPPQIDDMEGEPSIPPERTSQDTTQTQTVLAPASETPKMDQHTRGPRDISNILRQDEPPESEQVGQGRSERAEQGLGISGHPPASVRDHSLLSHMASVATAEAEARAAAASNSPHMPR
ncbi:hypothetical protein MKZ38_003507 [Zalerion maritima]|uniref:Zn(2)-C6 fungal-type domain-containing protein n=1 Tax=Zalerion maritima TaxID=339359 RepID=A0AAD5RX13_9PEZI|nr:hypothetical protein MKZ38_003507 [Zalerion maritima]